ncbi:MAG: DedA family protein [Anaerolineae bacterium]|jgi:membrane protein DedA with SNARE-associated domain
MSFEALVQQYGYAIIFLGSLAEGQPFMLFGGFAAHRGHLELLPWVILAGAVGNFLALQIWFLVGRKFGLPLIERRPAWAARVEKAQGWLAQYETLLIIGIRFIAGMTGIGSLAIGMSQVSTMRFTVLNGLGAVLWATTLGVAGYLLGSLLEVVLEDLEAVEKPLLIGIVVVAVIWVVYRYLQTARTARRESDTADERG